MAERTTQLLQHHAQVEATDDFDRTPLHVAHSDAAEKLLAAHANWIALDKNGNTSLHYAAEDGPRHLELLFRAGFNVIDARNNSGLTPLHFATLAGNTESARWLLDHGANPNAVTAAPYDYLPLSFYPGYGNETHVPAGISVAGIASMRHNRNEMVVGAPPRRKRFAERARRNNSVAAIANPDGFLHGRDGDVFHRVHHRNIFPRCPHDRMARAAQRFPAAGEPPSIYKRQNGGLGLIGLVQMRNLLRAAATDQGLYLAFPKMLSAGHAPLLIPWPQLRITDDKTVFGIRILTLQAGEPKIARIMLRGGIAESVAKRLGIEH